MNDVTAAQLMTPEVIVLQEDMPLREAAERLLENEISGAPVEDQEGRLVGVLSLTDIALTATGDSGVKKDRSDPEFYLTGWEERLDPTDMPRFHIENEDVTVGDVMTPEVYTVSAEATAREVAKTMLDSHLHRLLVLRDERLVGIVSSFDLLQLLAGEA